jgi:hypothetical protein
LEKALCWIMRISYSRGNLISLGKYHCSQTEIE